MRPSPVVATIDARTVARRTAAHRTPLPAIATALAAFIAVAHIEAAVQAIGASPLLGTWLLAVAALVAGWVWAAVRRGGGAVWLGTALFGALALVWIVSRTAGLPLAGGLRAPVGPLDAITCLDELLLAAVCARWAGGRTGNARLAASAYVALSGSFVILSMGCGVGAAGGAQHAWAAGHGAALFCHLI